MPRKVDLTGRVYGYLTVVDFAGTWGDGHGKFPHRHWNCRCTCGGQCVVRTHDLSRGVIWHCPDCSPQRGVDYREDFESHMKTFSSTERAELRELLRGRTDKLSMAEAVDVIMRERQHAA